MERSLLNSFTLWAGCALLICFILLGLYLWRFRWGSRRTPGALGNAVTRVWTRNWHDSITGLPNRASFLGYLTGEMRVAAAQKNRLGLLYIRILNFPEINLLAGYAIGDKLLRTISDNLAGQFGREVGVISPGSFVVLLNCIGNEDGAYQDARALLDIIQTPLLIDEISFEPRCAGGLSLFPEHGTCALQLLRNAELAHTAGLELRRRIVIYSNEYEPDVRQLSLMSDFTTALKRQEFTLMCQPKLDLQNREIIGGEILVRWQHPVFGELSPDDFIPLAEKTGFIKSITLYILQEVIYFLQRHLDSLGALQFSVNVAAKDISDPDFGTRVHKIVGGYAPNLLLEITETDAIQDRRQVLQTAMQLHESGIALSIDDFGTGYSSLSYLKELNPDELKIDKLFIRDLLRSENDTALVRSTIQLAHELGISVVAEGVEDNDTLEMLTKLGCDKAQGFGISRPVPLEEFAAWYFSHTAIGGI